MLVSGLHPVLVTDTPSPLTIQNPISTAPGFSKCNGAKRRNIYLFRAWWFDPHQLVLHRQRLYLVDVPEKDPFSAGIESLGHRDVVIGRKPRRSIYTSRFVWQDK